jgi:hypothetical protein
LWFRFLYTIRVPPETEKSCNMAYFGTGVKDPYRMASSIPQIIFLFKFTSFHVYLSDLSWRALRSQDL